MKINIGELNKRITFIEKIEDKKDEDGFPIAGVPKETKSWAKVWNQSGTEIFKANSDYSKVVTHFIIRYRKNFIPTESMQISFNNNTYDIKYVNDYNYKHEFVEIVGEVLTNV